MALQNPECSSGQPPFRAFVMEVRVVASLAVVVVVVVPALTPLQQTNGKVCWHRGQGLP